MAPGWYLDLAFAGLFMTARLPLRGLTTDERPFASSRWGVESGVFSRLRRERLVSFRPTEAGVPDRDPSGSSSESTVRDLRLGIEGIVAVASVNKKCPRSERFPKRERHGEIRDCQATLEQSGNPQSPLQDRAATLNCTSHPHNAGQDVHRMP